MEVEDDCTDRSEKNCTTAPSVTSFFINDILNSTKSKEDSAEMQERALDMSTKWNNNGKLQIGLHNNNNILIIIAS